jgi:hypothetical protein
MNVLAHPKCTRVNETSRWGAMQDTPTLKAEALNKILPTSSGSVSKKNVKYCYPCNRS